ncbi:MAG: hypothetical protein ACJAZS_000225 [Alteromonas naphthalenivorans]|jgi:hypothetical protein
MNTKILLAKFSSALQWNSFFYVIYKVFSVALSFTLYGTLSTSMFSAWALLQSIVFLILLWLDCGFRKSIPRYCPEFAQHKHTHKTFIALVLSIQSIVLLLALPILWFVLPTFIAHKNFIPYALVMFAIGGISELFKSIYHAHFWQKQFNLLQTVCTLTEMICNFWYIFYVAPSVTNTQLVMFLFTTKIAASFGIIAGSLALLPQLFKSTKYLEKTTGTKTSALVKPFLEHSIMMWATTSIKSLSERNFLFPFLTNAFGPALANLFKVVHDGALFFQRIAIRILGSADTALLSYALVLNNTQTTYQQALIRLFRTIIAMIVPLACLSIGAFFFKSYALINNNMLLLFFVVAFGYMFEVLLSPYERVLEVKRRYRLLWVSYAPYVVGLTLLLVWPLSVSLVQWVFLVHTLRLIGSLLMAYFASKLS